MTVSEEHRERILRHLEKQERDPFAKIEDGPPRRVADDLRRTLKIVVDNAKAL